MSETLTISPNPVAAGESFTATAGGLHPGQVYSIGFWSPANNGTQGGGDKAEADANGQLVVGGVGIVTGEWQATLQRWTGGNQPRDILTVPYTVV